MADELVGSVAIIAAGETICLVAAVAKRHEMRAKCYPTFRMIWPLLLLLAISEARRSSDRDFREPPRDKTVRLGEDVLFRCVANDASPTNTQWKHSNGLLLGTDDVKIKGFDNRLSYLKEKPSELHLQVNNVSLGDDGLFECQMITSDGKPIRSVASLTVLVPPERVYFEHYDTNSTIDVNEGSSLNVTCVSRNAKPAAKIRWFVNGKEVEDTVHRWEEYNGNNTQTAFAALSWKPSRNDHEKMLTCHVKHEQTGFEERITLTMDVRYSSERPVIEVVKEAERIKSGNNVTLICVAEGGNPPPRLSWNLNENPVQAAFEYEIENKRARNVHSLIAKPSDNGAIYVCSSSNRDDIPALKSTVALEVDYPPSYVHFVNVSTSVRYGDSITITCRSGESHPPSTIHWEMDGQPFGTSLSRQENTRQGTVSESSLTIDTKSLLITKQQILIDCRATNSEGSVSMQHSVKVNSPPMPPMIKRSSSGPYIEGETLNLTCEAVGGNPLASLTWYRPKMEKAHSDIVDGAKSRSSLQVRIDRSMNNLTIKCQIDDHPALDYPLNDTILLEVYFPPSRMSVRKYEENDGKDEIIAGKDTRLSCSIPSSNPPAEVNWEVDIGEDRPLQIDGAYLVKRGTEENYGYTVENVVTFQPRMEMDGRVARCIATNPVWNSTVKSEYRMVVYYPPKLEVESPLTLTMVEGDTFKEEIALSANPPVQSYYWKKNGIPFTEIVGNVYVRGNVIGGRNLKKEDSGTYVMVASNKRGEVILTINIEVKYSPRIVYITTPMFGDEGDSMILECEADAYPVVPRMVKWTKAGITLRDQNSDDSRRAVLKITASQATSGAYVCIADNGIGQPNSSTAYVLLNSPPVIVKNRGFNRAAGPINGRARARCLVQVVPDAQFVWSLEDGQPIRNGTKYIISEKPIDHATRESVLTITNLTHKDYSKQIRCLASNRKGSDHIHIKVEDLTHPDKPEHVTVYETGTKSAIVTWNAGFDGGLEQFFEVRYGSKGDSIASSGNTSETRFTLSSLEASTSYFAQVRAINERGRVSEWSEWVQIRTLTENGTALMEENEDNMFANNWIFFFLIIMAALLLINCGVFAYIYVQHRRRLQAEKTQFAREQNYGNERRPLQLYGTIGAGGGLSPATLIRRPESNNTNKSDLMNEPVSEDEQSVRTMIQVSPNGMIQRHNQPVNRFYDGNFVTDEENDPSCYSVINKHGTLKSNYTHFKGPEPYPLNGNGSPSLTYADVGGSLRRGFDSPRRFGSVSGSINEDPRYVGTGTLPHRTHQPSFTTFGTNPRIVGNPDGDLV
ncbi:unnamed protein product [Bursaphelenchus okinawaensis]|uniref:Nephrin n=1 Tax=Bursaphelenchus okinawaensis TaxID=465554 RepID=A0A811KIF3_9BILA|nr:unnamed protein product [Bursaphelenchus okinawaensis]CAG9103803.1 unnamed protein product [Bursaphelenchus okinawaensis]